MNKYLKTLAICAMLFLTGSAFAQHGQPEAAAPAQEQAAPAPVAPMDLTPCASVYLPQMDAVVIIDSIDCAVDLLVRDGQEMQRVGRFTTDVYQGRHDLKNIVRPRSVAVLGHCIVVLASSQKDSSYLAIVPMCQAIHGGCDTMQAATILGFSNSSYAFRFDESNREFIVVGKNPVGYDVHIATVSEEGLAAVSDFHYHVPKQSERIKASDPHGVGLTVSAVVVVFFALICICFIMKGYAGAIMKVQNRRANKSAAKSAAKGAEAVPVVKSSEVSGEVYAAIAAAIYAYDEDMHDDEDTVITIQKVERAWTPWNAKFYNMNKYFANRK